MTKQTNQSPIRVIQFGEGNFLRAFVDWMISEMNSKASFDTGVAVVQPIEKGLVDILEQQQGRYTLFLKGLEDGEPARKKYEVDCIQKAINPYEQYEAYMELATLPELRFMVSNTTEAGIRVNSDDQIDNHPPSAFPGKLTVWLHHRFKTFQGDVSKGLIILPCELIDKNGDQLKKAVLAYCDLWKLEPEFITWVKTHNYFCNTLVDRIVPGYPKDTIDALKDELSFDDKLVVEGELFHLWVIEGDELVAQALPTKQAGLNVTFTNNLSLFRTRKVRILNGAHTAMVPLGILMGLETVKEAVEHESLGQFIREMVFEEIVPCIDLPEEERMAFAHDVLERFRNPYIRHELASIALNSFSKFKTRNLPSMLDYKEQFGTWPEKLMIAFAALISFYKGTVGERVLPVKDDPEIMEKMKLSWSQNPSDTEKVVDTVFEMQQLWGEEIVKYQDLKQHLSTQLKVLESEGIHQLINIKLNQ